MSNPSPAFARLIAPFGVEEFFRRYWEQQPLYLRREAPRYYDDTLTVDEVDRYFQSQHLSSHFLGVLKDGEYCPHEQWVHIDPRKGPRNGAGQVVDVQKLLALFSAGATIIINSGETGIPSLTGLSRALAYELTCHVQTNLYLTPPGTQGFPPHFDAHNVFILQIDGRKHWRLYDAPVEAPVRATPVDATHYDTRQPLQSIELHPGDLLYIPRGTVHCARAEETPSIHVTVGPMVRHWSTLLRMLAEQADEDPAFRRLLPHGLSGAQEQGDFAASFTRQVQALLARVDLPKLPYTSFVEEQRMDCRSRFTDLLQIEQLTPDSVVRRRPSLHYLIDQTDQWIIMRFESEELSVPTFLAPALDTLLREQPFAVREIAGVPNDGGKLALVRRFVRAGFLTIVSA